MVKSLFSFTVLFLLFSCSHQEEVSPIIAEKSFEDISIIPAPSKLDANPGQFSLNEESVITFFPHDSLSSEAEYLKQLIDYSSSFQIEIKQPRADTNYVHLVLDKELQDFGDEAYSIWMSPEALIISAASEIGIMRGIQTFRQIMPVEFHTEAKVDEWRIPCLNIDDYPAFEHRGFLLDVCRHFFEKEIVLEYIDLMAFYKLNVLHLHLTEDQGWRFMSDKYPLLNSISSVRTESDGLIYGGTYSKVDLKEIVDYAATRHITVIPEIEMPGHSQAAIAAYPHLSCTGGEVDVANDWGVFKEIYCAGNDSTFIFLEEILSEVMEIFPSEFIHIGGDEAPKTRWETCEKCQKRIEDEGLQNENELQTYFISRIETFLSAKGRKIIGWDEILDGGLSGSSTLQSWRGYEGGIEAAELGHKVIMSPTSHCYLDYGLKTIDLAKIYSFSPIPENMDPEDMAFIKGGECNMWTEHVPDKHTLDRMVFPRMIGFAEALWTIPHRKDYARFYENLQSHYPILEGWGIEYGQEFVGATIHLDSNNSKLIHITVKTPEITAKYRWINGKDNQKFTEYTGPIDLDRTGQLEVRTFKREKQYGEDITQNFAHHIALQNAILYKTAYNNWYTAGGESGLVDGKLGSLDFRDGNWQGFWGKNMELVINLGHPQTITKVSTQFYHYANAWIMKPKKVEVILLDENQKELSRWTEELTHHHLDNTQEISKVEIEIEEVKGVSFVQVNCTNYGLMPATHDAAGEPSWIFIDELIIE